ncbi:MAG: type II secretion system F family protein [Pseudomonadota bacterium]
MSTEQAIFIGMVFMAVFLLARSLLVPTMSAQAQAGKRLRGRVNSVIGKMDQATQSLLREKYLRQLTPFERWMESLPGMEGLAMTIEQAGRKITAFRLVLMSMVLGAFAGLLVTLLLRQPLFGMVSAVVVFFLPLLKVRLERAKRLNRFEEQLPDALDIMSRALKAGYPFTETLKLVAEESYDPIAGEFGTTFSDINYGMGVKTAFLGMLQRIPSLSLMAVITAVLVQRESGGNLAEILEKISAVVRKRFQFQRRLRTLSAEGRLSAWILSLIPFVLAAVMSVTSPEYLPMLIKDPLGMKLVMGAFGAIIIGIFWMQRIIRIQV